MVLPAVLLVAAFAPPALAHDGSGGSSPGSRTTFRMAAKPTEPPERATPQGRCLSGSHPEPGMQGRLPKSEVDSGRADRGYWCNLRRIGHVGATGGFRVHRYVDKAGHECAYYDTTLLFPTNTFNLSRDPTGVAVLDMSNPRKPKRVRTLATPAMQTPHESVNISVKRGVLAAVMGNPVRYPGGVDVYDISKDCRNPVPMAAAFPATPFGHESGMSPDGLTFWPSSADIPFSAVDISNMRFPRELWRSDEWSTHGLEISNDGRRAYLASIDNGLIILDTSEVQDRKPDPQVREVGRVTWSNKSIPQVPLPVTIKGRPYIVEIDEYAVDENDEIRPHADTVGAARIIDISDERNPFVVSNLRLAVHQRQNRPAIAGDYGAQNPTQGYGGHYCQVPRRKNPGIVACTMILSGLRVFDIRDPKNPREIAYHVAPPSHVSEIGAPFIDERANWAMSQPAFAPKRGEIWYSDGTSGFYALKMDPRVWPFKRGRATGRRRTVRRLRLTVRPRRVRAGRRVRLRFLVRSRGRRVRRARVRIAGRSVRTDRRGRARLRVRFKRARSYRARATKRGYRPDTARVRAVRRARFTG